jgi:hypothetical protein
MTRQGSLFFLLAAVSAIAHGTNPVPDANCPEYDEFYQVYEFTSLVQDLSAGACPGSVLTGSPAYPERRIDVRIEYRRGQYFVAQETREWSVDPTDSGCMLIQPRLVREYRMYRDGQLEWARYAPDKTRRTRDGDHINNSLIAGIAQARQPEPNKVEETPFGVNCGRIDGTNMNPPNVFPGASMCSVYLPKKCRAELYMAPIELIAGMPGFGPMRGRTRELVVGSEAAVDPSTWSVP